MVTGSYGLGSMLRYRTRLVPTLSLLLLHDVVWQNNSSFIGYLDGIKYARLCSFLPCLLVCKADYVTTLVCRQCLEKFLFVCTVHGMLVCILGFGKLREHCGALLPCSKQSMDANHCRGCGDILAVRHCVHAITSIVKNATWLILPVVICLSQRLSHACVSMN